MSSETGTVENTIHNIGNDMRNRFTEVASRVREEAQAAKETISDTLEHHRQFAAEKLDDAGKNAARLTRRYPLQILAGAVVLGFLIGRIRR